MSSIYPNRLDRGQIRLLDLQPGSKDEAIEIRLITTDLSHAPDFEAISYVWGDRSREKHICLVGGAEICVTESLYDALLQLKLPQASRMLWADRICINQQDLEERSQQVSIMRHIFTQARQVVVWLGQDSGEKLHLAARAITIIYQRCMDYAESQGLSLEDMADHHFDEVPITETTSLDDAFDEETWLALGRFYGRPWFTRIWCVQEILLARQSVMLTDTCHLPWNHVAKAAFALVLQITKPPYSDAPPRQCDKAMTCSTAVQLYTHPAGADLLDDLESFQYHEATDPRDFVYGLLGLQDPDSISHALEPDYSKSTADVYAESAMATIGPDSGGQLRVLSNVQHGDELQREDDWPSWTPHWHSPRYVSLFNRGEWSAGGDEPAEVTFPTRKELKARGAIFDEIVFVSQIHPKNHDGFGPLHPFPELMLALYQETDRSDVTNESSQIKLQKLCQTLAGGYITNTQLLHELGHNERLAFYSDYLAFIERCFVRCKDQGSRDTPLPLFRSPHSDGDWQRYARSVRYACRYRRIFRTRKGHLGLGPACCAVRDPVCVLQGGEVPYVLRPATDGASYHFLGECFVEGIMQGELFRDDGDGAESPTTTMLSIK